jgi:hypothetical protein
LGIPISAPCSARPRGQLNLLLSDIQSVSSSTALVHSTQQCLPSPHLTGITPAFARAFMSVTFIRYQLFRVPIISHLGREYSHASGLNMRQACARRPVNCPLCPANYRPAIRHRPLNTNYFRPYVSLSRHRLRVLIIQWEFPTNYQQCAQSLRKTDKKGFTRPSTRLTAPGL